jgi:hypothetical protein
VVLAVSSACGARVTDFENQGPRSPRFVLEGQCAPSSVSTPVQVASFQSSCLGSLSAPRLIEEVAQFDGLFDVNCQKPEIDFAANRALIVPARGASEWFVFTNFVNERSDALEIGLVIRPQGALPPDSIVVLPRSPGSVELRWCRSVCVENCDVAIP